METAATVTAAAAALVPQTTLARGRIIYPFSMVVSGPGRKGVSQIVDIVPGVYIILCAICVCVYGGLERCRVCTADGCRRWCMYATRGRNETSRFTCPYVHIYIYININNIKYMVHVGCCFVIRRDVVVRPLIKHRARKAAAVLHRTRQLPFRRAFCTSATIILLSPPFVACDVMSAARTGEYEIVCDSPVHIL